MKHKIVAPSTLNYPNALRVAEIILSKFSGKLPTDFEDRVVITTAILNLTEAETSWILSLFSKVSFTAIGQLDELIKFLELNDILRVCKLLEEQWQQH